MFCTLANGPHLRLWGNCVAIAAVIAVAVAIGIAIVDATAVRPVASASDAVSVWRARAAATPSLQQE